MVFCGSTFVVQKRGNLLSISHYLRLPVCALASRNPRRTEDRRVVETRERIPAPLSPSRRVSIAASSSRSVFPGSPQNAMTRAVNIQTLQHVQYKETRDNKDRTPARSLTTYSPSPAKPPALPRHRRRGPS